MAVEIPAENAWLGKPVIVSNMQDVAKSDRAWRVYQALTPLQKQNFLIALSLDIIVRYATVIEVSASQAAQANPVQVQATPVPESIVGYTRHKDFFKDWLTRQATLVSSHAALRFALGNAYGLKDGTVSIPIDIVRDNRIHPNTQFVYHYHPGASGPAVGQAYASEGHFKPYDGAPKHVRVEKHESVGDLAGLRRDAKARAKQFKS